MTHDVQPARPRVILKKTCAGMVCLVVLSRLYEIALVSLSRWGLVTFETVRGLFEKMPLLIAHVPIVILAAGFGYLYGWSKRDSRVSRRAALAWTSVAVSGHVFTVVFC